MAAQAPARVPALALLLLLAAAALCPLRGAEGRIEKSVIKHDDRGLVPVSAAFGFEPLGSIRITVRQGRTRRGAPRACAPREADAPRPASVAGERDVHGAERGRDREGYRQDEDRLLPLEGLGRLRLSGLDLGVLRRRGHRQDGENF